MKRALFKRYSLMVFPLGNMPDSSAYTIELLSIGETSCWKNFAVKFFHKSFIHPLIIREGE